MIKIMKNFKLMLSACIAAVVFTSCEKEELVPQNTRMKSVEVSLENAAFSATRGDAGDKIKAGQAVIVNDLKFFLLDNAGKEYSAKVSDGSKEAQSYWTAKELETNGLDFAFHYVDHGCSKIVAVANVGDPNLSYEKFLQNQNLNIDNEQDSKSLRLFAQATLTPNGEQHNNKNTDGTTYVSDVYTADLLLKPRISRFEVDGFRVKFDATNPKYTDIKFTDMLFDHYPTMTSLLTGEESTSHTVHIADLNVQSTVYNWFNNTDKPEAWYWDSFEATVSPTVPAASCDSLAYHTFAGVTIPRLVIKLLVDGQPAYLYSKGFYSTTNLTGGEPTLIEALEEGCIYRMSAAGATDEEKDGYIPIDEEDLDPMDRCLEIKVDVHKWVVDFVYPEF